MNFSGCSRGYCTVSWSSCLTLSRPPTSSHLTVGTSTSLAQGRRVGSAEGETEVLHGDTERVRHLRVDGVLLEVDEVHLLTNLLHGSFRAKSSENGTDVAVGIRCNLKRIQLAQVSATSASPNLPARDQRRPRASYSSCGCGGSRDGRWDWGCRVDLTLEVSGHRRRAGPMELGRLVAAMTMTLERASRPSMR